MRIEKINIEIITFNEIETQLCKNFGVDRVELVKNLDKGGLTPDREIIQKACEVKGIQVFVMIRPHDKSFFYNNSEKMQILDEIKWIIDNTKAKGIVVGCLKKNNNIDWKFLNKIFNICENKILVTFHRAIDESRNYLRNIHLLLKNKNIHLILTSLNKPKLDINSKYLKILNSNLNANKIQLGASINSENIQSFFKYRNIKHFHVGTGARTNLLIDEEKIKKITKLINNN